MELARLLEVSQVRRWLVLADRHQEAIRALEVPVLADDDVVVSLVAKIFRPQRLVLTIVVPRHRPGPGQRVVDGRDLRMKKIRLLRFAVDSFLDHGPVVLMHRQTVGIEEAWTLEVPGLHFEYVVFAIAVLIDPFADRIAFK